MLQFYFLSVFLNVLAGYLLFFWDESGSSEGKSGFSLQGDTFILITGILSAITGLVKLFSPIGGSLPIIGDLIPAAAGLVCGFVLLFGYFQRRSSIDDSEHTKKIDGLLAGNKKIIGAVAFVAAVLHFLFPGAPLI
jgi:uncharacterized membrane-anchored protein